MAKRGAPSTHLPMIGLLERALTFKPNNIDHGALLNRPHARHRIGATHGLDLDSVWLDQASPIAVLLIHGNRHNLTKFADHYNLFSDLGLSCFAFDFPGYGQSAGSPTEESVYQSAASAYSFLRTELQYAPNRIVIYGCSLGGAVAIHLAQNSPAACLITESTFTSSRDMAAHLYPWLPFRSLLPDRFSNVTKIKAVTMPHLILHGARDEVVPVYMARALFDTAKEPKKLVLVPDASHTDVLPSGGAMVREEIATFIDQATAT